MSRILLTGSQGFFGTRFLTVHGDNHTVLGIDKDDVDITDREAVLRTIREFRPDLVIHAAAITATDFSNAHPELTRRINVDGAVHVAEGAREVDSSLIFFSTEQVFNGNSGAGPYTESDVPEPDTMYGITKLEAESKVKDIVEKLWVLRFTWLFGLPEYRMPVNPNILWNTLQIAGSGRRTPVPVNEYRGHTDGYAMINAIMKVPDIPFGTYHIGSRNSLGRYEITSHILREFGLSDRLDELVEPDEKKYAVPRDVRLDTGRIARERITFEESREALSRVIREFNLTGAFS